jgi:uncharacterized protein YaaN involved in tellurite resistance
MSSSADVATPADELVIDPPASAAAKAGQVGQPSSEIHIDKEVADRISAAVDQFVESLAQLDSQSPEFEKKVQSISRMGNDEIRRSAEASSRFLERPAVALQRGPMSQGSQVSTALLSLRKQIEDLDPSQHMSRRYGFLNRTPFGERVTGYVRKYQSAQSTIEAIINGLYRGQDELMRDNAAIEQEKVHLWAVKGRLEQYAYMASVLDESVTRKAEAVSQNDPVKGKALKEDVLFYVRQKRQDILTQLSVNVQGYLALDLIRKNNVELIKGVERATTTTVSALRTGVIAALALGNQRQVLAQTTALNTTTGNIIEWTSQMLRQQSADIQNQAASATVSMEKLQAAFNNIYATMDSIDTFKVAALESMRKSIDALSTEVAKAKVYLDRARTSELAQANAQQLASELVLPNPAVGV